MARIFVEGWSPEYGSPLDTAELAPAEGSVDDTVEAMAWEAREGVDDGIEQLAFVDGVRRIDARLTIDDPVAGPVPGVCGTFAVGAVQWDRTEVRSTVDEVRLERWAIISCGRPELFPTIDLQPPYETITIANRDGDALVYALQTKMREAEGVLATELSDDAFVFADGPLNQLGPHEVVELEELIIVDHDAEGGRAGVLGPEDAADRPLRHDATRCATAPRSAR